MTRDEFNKIVNAGNAVGLTKYVIRAEGGNRMFYNNGESSIIYPDTTHAICFELSRNYAEPNGQFNITLIPYDNMDTLKFIDIPFVEGLNMMKALGCKDDKLIEMVKHIPRRQDIKPGTAGLAPITDKKGKDVITTAVPGYVTK